MKKLILLSGLPGCGKSTWANEYVKEHKDEKIFIVSSDELRKELGGYVQYFKEEKKVWELFLSRSLNYGRIYDDVTVIMDATNLTNFYRKKYYESTPIFNYHCLYYFNIPLEKVLVQNKQRSADRIVIDEAMEHLINELEPVSQEVKDLYDEYVEVTY